jgi:hypothetical protein
MRRSRRSLSKTSKAAAEPEPEVVSLLDDDEAAGDENGTAHASTTHVSAAPAATVKSPLKQARKPASARKAAKSAKKAVEYDGEYAFPSEDEEQQQRSDTSDGDWQQPQPANQQPKQRRQRKQQLQESDEEDIDEVQGLISQAVTKRSGSKRPAASAAATAALSGAAAAGNGAAAQQPQSKRTKTTSSSAAPARKAAASKGARAAAAATAAAAGAKGSKQTTLHSRGFGALCFSASQPAGSGQTGTQQTGSQGGCCLVNAKHAVVLYGRLEPMLASGYANKPASHRARVHASETCFSCVFCC